MRWVSLLYIAVLLAGCYDDAATSSSERLPDFNGHKLAVQETTHSSVPSYERRGYEDRFVDVSFGLYLNDKEYAQPPYVREPNFCKEHGGPAPNEQARCVNVFIDVFNHSPYNLTVEMSSRTPAVNDNDIHVEYWSAAWDWNPRVTHYANEFPDAKALNGTWPIVRPSQWLRLDAAIWLDVGRIADDYWINATYQHRPEGLAPSPSFPLRNVLPCERLWTETQCHGWT